MGKKWTRFFGVVLVALLVMGSLTACGGGGGGGAGDGKPGKIIVGGKTFSEQFLLAELLSILIQEKLGVETETKINLGTSVLFEAMAADEIDVYIEYTGTGLMAILGKDLVTDPDEVYNIVAKEYEEQYGIKWLKPWGFNNTYAMVMRRDKAEELNLATISDLAKIGDQLVLGASHEFAERVDGAPGLQEHYGFKFKDIVNMDPALMYQAVAEGEVDVISGFATEGRIPAFDLVALEDDKHFFPPYHAAPIVRKEILEAYPELEDVLNQLAGFFTDETMAALNAEIDVKGRDPDEVAREFLTENGFI
ncbi:MAG TPA: glycine/betaine ABC transporter substrate-binding protein [Firmicutes bacterium]|nr:glycine/betaine ABC transporter substrate-binding protein [Bacillota bacterium]